MTDRIHVVDGTFVGFGITVYGHERAPGVATLDTVTANPGGEALDVAWSAPDETGDSDIASYDVRYIEADADGTDPLAGPCWKACGRPTPVKDWSTRSLG